MKEQIKQDGGGFLIGSQGDRLLNGSCSLVKVGGPYSEYIQPDDIQKGLFKCYKYILCPNNWFFGGWIDEFFSPDGEEVLFVDEEKNAYRHYHNGINWVVKYRSCYKCRKNISKCGCESAGRRSKNEISSL